MRDYHESCSTDSLFASARSSAQLRMSKWGDEDLDDDSIVVQPTNAQGIKKVVEYKTNDKGQKVPTCPPPSPPPRPFPLSWCLFFFLSPDVCKRIQLASGSILFSINMCLIHRSRLPKQSNSTQPSSAFLLESRSVERFLCSYSFLSLFSPPTSPESRPSER